MTATKYDQEKPAYQLIDVEFDADVIHFDGPAGAGISPEAHLRAWTASGELRDLCWAFRGVVAMANVRDPIGFARIELARVLHFGASKYSANNWREGFAWSRLWRAAYGHIQSHRRGDVYDEDTGRLHLSHALCMLMFLYVHQRDGLGWDDRDEIWPTRP